MNWISVKDRLPEEYKDVIICGPFDCHYDAVAAAHWKACESGGIRWWNPGSNYSNDWLAYEHEVEYWADYPEFVNPEKPIE